MTEQIEAILSEAVNKIVEDKIAELIKECSSAFSSPEPPKRVYTVEEIQNILDVGRCTAYDLIKTGQFKTVKIGGHYRISKKSFDEWLDKMEEIEL